MGQEREQRRRRAKILLIIEIFAFAFTYVIGGIISFLFSHPSIWTTILIWSLIGLVLWIIFIYFAFRWYRKFTR
jgi:fatty acid desaturase